MWMDYSLVTLQAVVPDAPVGVLGTGGAGYPMGPGAGDTKVGHLFPVAHKWLETGQRTRSGKDNGRSREVWGRQSQGETTVVGNRSSSAPLCQFSRGLFSLRNIG